MTRKFLEVQANTAERPSSLSRERLYLNGKIKSLADDEFCKLVNILWSLEMGTEMQLTFLIEDLIHHNTNILFPL
jgi:hypothetical protein